MSSVTPASANDGLLPISLSYDVLGRLIESSREQPSGGDPANTFVVYGISVNGNGLALPNLSSTEVAKWAQPLSDSPSSGVAVFSPNPNEPDLSPPDPTDLTSDLWAYADITYLNGLGAAVNSAVVGDNQWLIDTNVYDYVANAGGQVVSTLSAANRIIALDTQQDCADAGAAPIVCQQQSFDRALALSTITVYDPNTPGVVTDTYGPITQIANPSQSGSLIAARTHTHTTYNEGAPADVIQSGAALPTTTSEGAWQTTNGVIPPRTPSSSTGDLDVRVTHTGYDIGFNVPGAVTGWQQRAATSTTVVGSSSGDITTASAISATGFTLASKQPTSNGADAGTTRSWQYSAGAAENGAPALCGNHPGWDGLTCYTAPAAQPTEPAGVTLPTTAIQQYSPLLAPEVSASQSGSDSVTTSITYDNAGRPITTTIASQGGGASVDPTTTAYDPNTGLVASTTRDAASVSTTYDTWGRSIKTTGLDGSSTSTTYNIDSSLLLVQSWFVTNEYTYDVPRTDEQLGDQRGLLTGLSTEVIASSAPEDWRASYGPTGDPVVSLAPNDVQTDSSYDVTGKLTKQAVTADQGVQPLLAPFTQVFSSHGQVVQSTGPSGPAATAGAVYSATASYDAASRLVADSVTASGASTSRSYAWDADSNRTGMTTTRAGRTVQQIGHYNSADMSVETTTTGSSGSSTYTYDSFGRTTTLPGQATTGGNDIQYTWLANGRVNTQSTTDASGPVTQTNTWDALDRLSTPQTTTPAGTSQQLITYSDASSDSPQAISTVAPDSSISRQVFSPSITGGLGLITSETIGKTNGITDPSWWHLPADSDSSDLQITNPHGDVITTISNEENVEPTKLATVTVYQPFGDVNDGTLPQPYGWEGGSQRSNQNPGNLLSMGARIYNPTTGRFLTTDPVPGGNSNAYTYPPDPINAQDLDGSASSDIASNCGAAGPGRVGKCLEIAGWVSTYVDGWFGGGGGAGRNSNDRNAMRHVMFAMLLSWSIGGSRTRSVLNAHEANSRDWSDTVADQQNNKIGLRAANRLRGQAGEFWHLGRLNQWRKDTAKAVYDRKRIRGKVWCPYRSKSWGAYRCTADWDRNQGP